MNSRVKKKKWKQRIFNFGANTAVMPRVASDMFQNQEPGFRGQPDRRPDGPLCSARRARYHVHHAQGNTHTHTLFTPPQACGAPQNVKEQFSQGLVRGSGPSARKRITTEQSFHFFRYALWEYRGNVESIVDTQSNQTSSIPSGSFGSISCLRLCHECNHLCTFWLLSGGA